MNEQPSTSQTSTSDSIVVHQKPAWRVYSLIFFAFIGMVLVNSIKSTIWDMYLGSITISLIFGISTAIEAVLIGYVAAMGFIHALNWTMTRAKAKRYFVIFLIGLGVGLLGLTPMTQGINSGSGEGVWAGLVVMIIVLIVLFFSAIGALMVWLALFKIIQPEQSAAVSIPSQDPQTDKI